MEGERNGMVEGSSKIDARSAKVMMAGKSSAVQQIISSESRDSCLMLDGAQHEVTVEQQARLMLWPDPNARIMLLTKTVAPSLQH